MTLYTTVEAAQKAVVDFNGSPEEFLLPVSDELQDSMGITAAIITDAALAKGWQPAGFEQHDGYRIYKFAQMK